MINNPPEELIVSDTRGPVFIIRATPIKDGEILYDRNGLASAIKTKGQILAILEGEE